MLDSSGNEVSRFVEFVKPDKFVAAMKKVPAGPGASAMNK
jgi:hypothetical protein